MRDTFLPFSKPDLKESDIQAVADVLRSGWITTGPKVAQLEADFKQYLGSPDAISMTSETGVMEVLLHALEIGPGDEVITPSMTWVSMINLTVLAGATPVFVDVNRDTLMVDPDEVEAHITPRTKLIVPVHFAGACADMDPLRAIAQKHGIRLVEDAAHAIGTRYKGRLIGSTGTAMFSLHPIKNITTGEGGMLVTDDEELGKRARSLKFHGLGVDAYDRLTHGRSPQAQVVEPGYKYNLPDMQAVLALGQLARIEEINARRTALALRYRELLSGIDELQPLADPEYDFKHAWHLFVVRVVKGKLNRDEFMAALKEKNIGTGLHFRCTHLQKYYREQMGCKPGMLPNTEWNSDRICSIPLFPSMTEEDQDDVIATIKEVLA
jgi:UDP-4-amino-4-deoxy-L-arabinose--oxoglutarate aminotransferase